MRLTLLSTPLKPSRLSAMGLVSCLWLLTATVLGIRLLSLGLYPLMDTTEARYGEMARIMLETQQWVTPMFDYGVPFWGKPPIFSWLSALGMQLFGVNEFAARVPHFLVGLSVLAMLYWSVWRADLLRIPEAKKRAEAAALCTLVVASSLGFIVISGAVMTDIALLASLSLSWLALALFHRQASRRAGYVFFAGMALGLLSKGPVAIVMLGIGVLLWAIFTRQWQTLRRLPWVSGTLLTLSLSLPWYILAERQFPGFLEYFLWGEHVQRFLVSGWQGDLYGNAHRAPKGIIWWFFVQCSFPWVPIVGFHLWRQRKAMRFEGKPLSLTPNSGLLLCWLLSPLLLFTLSGNVLASYALPCVPPFALAIAHFHAHHQRLSAGLLKWALSIPLLLLLVLAYLIQGGGDRKSDKALLSHWQPIPSTPLVYLGKRPFSGQFYSQGKARSITSKRLVDYLQSTPSSSTVVLSNEAWRTQSGGAKVVQRCSVLAQSRARVLLSCKAEP